MISIDFQWSLSPCPVHSWSRPSPAVLCKVAPLDGADQRMDDPPEVSGSSAEAGGWGMWRMVEQCWTCFDLFWYVLNCFDYFILFDISSYYFRIFLQFLDYWSKMEMKWDEMNWNEMTWDDMRWNECGTPCSTSLHLLRVDSIR